MTQATTDRTDLAELTKLFPATIYNAGAGELVHLHLFHAPNSVCSQKVRAILFEAGAPFFSHLINVGKGETYEPTYVRMRAQACVANGLRFVSDHKGSTSVTETGCDACVVPTVIDETSGEVLVDSVRICVALDRKFEVGLRPGSLAEQIDSEIDVVDRLPNYPLLAAKMHGLVSGGGNPFALGKVERCNKLISAHAGDPLLVAAYTGKRDKELAANEYLFTNEALVQAENGMKRALNDLSARLSGTGRFLFGDELTLADIFWGVELVRIRDLGFGTSIDAISSLQAYEMGLRAQSCIQRAILDWPGAQPQLRFAS